MGDRSNRNFFGPQAISGVNPLVYDFPYEERNNNDGNVTLTSAGANAGYLIQFYQKVPVTFTKASILQIAGTVAGVNIYIGLYDSNENVLGQVKFTTNGVGGPTDILVGTPTPGSITIPVSPIYYVIAEDSVPASGIIGGTLTSAGVMNLRNQNAVANAFKNGFLAGGALPSTLGGIGTWTKTNIGQMGANSVAKMTVNP